MEIKKTGKLFSFCCMVPAIIKDKKYATTEEIEKINQEVKDKVKECEKFADESPYPEVNQLHDVVYEQEDYPFIK